MRWVKSNRFDPVGCAIADRHYSRQKIGSPQFVPPGRCLVLLSPAKRGAKALWVTTWQRYALHAWEGAWMNTLFRNEGAGLSSELILEAVACTRYHWRDHEEPKLGMVTFVDSSAVRPKKDPGYCYKKAGFIHVGETKVRGLLAFQLKPEDMPPAQPWLADTRQMEFEFSNA
jgi:hypothetical protein